jgi:hypothetical protein
MAQITRSKFLQLISQFHDLKRAGSIDNMQLRKWGKARIAQNLMRSESLKTLTTNEASDLYKSLPIPQKKRQDFLSNALLEIRECLWFLLYEEAPYEIRIWEFLDDMGGYRLIGGDQTLASALFCTHSPDTFGLVNITSSKGLRKLGALPKLQLNESHASHFQKTQESLWQIREMASFKDFPETDDFLESLVKGMLGEV